MQFSSSNGRILPIRHVARELVSALRHNATKQIKLPSGGSFSIVESERISEAAHRTVCIDRGLRNCSCETASTSLITQAGSLEQRRSRSLEGFDADRLNELRRLATIPAFRAPDPTLQRRRLFRGLSSPHRSGSSAWQNEHISSVWRPDDAPSSGRSRQGKTVAPSEVARQTSCRLRKR